MRIFDTMWKFRLSLGMTSQKITILKYQLFFTNLCAVVGSVVFKNIKQLRIAEQEYIRP